MILQVDATTHTLAKYLMELTIVNYDMAHHHPSEIAAAALCLSMKVLDGADWVIFKLKNYVVPCKIVNGVNSEKCNWNLRICFY